MVYDALYAKFSQNLDLRSMIIKTGTKEIVECSPYDFIWGNGLDIVNTLNTPKEQWQGKNRLGVCMMKVR